jgi:small-conductance mechanosensitive channel
VTVDLTTAVALALPLTFALVGLALGVLLRRTILRSRAGLPADGSRIRSIISALRAPLVLWCAILGLYISTEVVTLAPGIARVIQRALVVLVVLSVSWALGRIAATAVAHAAGVRRQLPAATLLVHVARLGVLALGLLIVLQTLGVAITPLLTALGVGGLAVGLALQDTLANFFAGIHILTSRQVRPGDYVQLASGEEGYVQDVTWRYTTIRQLANNLTVVPNAKLATSILTNYYLPEPALAVLVPVRVAYGSDLERVEAITIAVGQDVMHEVPGGDPTFQPFIRYNAFAESSITFTVILRGREVVDQHLIRHEFIKRLHHRYGAEGIEIPFPIRTVHLHSSSQPELQ